MGASAKAGAPIAFFARLGMRRPLLGRRTFDDPGLSLEVVIDPAETGL
jgi:hypothetical protein